MTNDDKTLVERLRSIYRVKLPNYIDDAADRIEAQAAEIERLREAGDRLVVFVRHYQRCATTRGRDYCNCDHDIVIKAWKEARAALGDTK